VARGIFRFVNGVADPHDLSLFGQSFVHPRVDLVEIADLDEHLHHVRVRTAVERSGKCRNTGRDAPYMPASVPATTRS
jgi:hypothetical protein